MPPRYRNWLTHVFDHPVRDPAWFFDMDAPRFDAPSDEIVGLVTHTFLWWLVWPVLGLPVVIG